MKCIVKRPDYNKNYVFDSGGDLLAYSQGDVPASWMNNSGDIKSVQFSKKENLQISDYSFYNCGLVGDLVIPDNTSSIGREAFKSSDSLNDVFLNIPVGSLFDGGADNVKPFYDGPTGKLYVTAEHINSFGGEGSQYAGAEPEGMEVALWSTYPDLP
jgi:hypothetical protein